MPPWAARNSFQVAADLPDPVVQDAATDHKGGLIQIAFESRFEFVQVCEDVTN